MTTTEYKIGPIVGSGRNKTAAREDAEAQAADCARRADIGVDIYSWRGAIVVVSPSVNGWGWDYRDGAMVPGLIERPRCWHGCGTSEDAKRSAQCGLFQSKFKIGEDPEEAASWITDSQAHAECIYWARWQNDYARLIAEGKTAQEAHELALR